MSVIGADGVLRRVVDDVVRDKLMALAHRTTPAALVRAAARAALGCVAARFDPEHPERIAIAEFFAHPERSGTNASIAPLTLPRFEGHPPNGHTLARRYQMSRRKRRKFTMEQKAQDAWGPAFSPDGKWIAYSSEKIGLYEIAVRSYPNGTMEHQISERRDRGRVVSPW